MNAAILLVTTAWFAGADPTPAAPAVSAATSAGSVASMPLSGGLGTGGCCGGGANSGGGCGCGCNECNDCCCKPSLMDRLRARRQSKNCCCDCGNSCGGCGGNAGGCGNASSCCTSNVSCGCNNCCEQCCCKPSLMDRLRARRQSNCCCNSCCESCGCGSGCGGAGMGGMGGMGGVGVPQSIVPGAEKIPNLPKESTPKKLPSKNGTVQSQPLGLTPASSANLLETEKSPF